MSIFKHKKEGNVRKTYFLGIPVASRIRVVYARGGGALSMLDMSISSLASSSKGHTASAKL